MKYRRLGDSGLKVSELSLGGWTTFGESVSDPQLVRGLITLAYDNGINFFDIADSYAKGGAERATRCPPAPFRTWSRRCPPSAWTWTSTRAR